MAALTKSSIQLGEEFHVKICFREGGPNHDHNKLGYTYIFGCFPKKWSKMFILDGIKATSMLTATTS